MFKGCLPEDCFIQKYSESRLNDESLETNLERDFQVKSVLASSEDTLVHRLRGLSDEYPSFCYSLKQNDFVSPRVRIRMPGRDLFVDFDKKPETVAKLVSCCSPSPIYNLDGSKELNETLRSCLELSPEKMVVQNTCPDYVLNQEFKEKCCPYLENLWVEFQKLLVYQPGAFINRHCDSQSDTNHIGTLILNTDSKYEGGDLIIHNSDNKITRLGNDFKSVCILNGVEHEVTPVTKGLRIVLVYKIFASSSNFIDYSIRQNHSDIQEMLSELVWRDGLQNEPEYKGLIILLKSKYTLEAVLGKQVHGFDRLLLDFLNNFFRDQVDIVPLQVETNHISSRLGHILPTDFDFEELKDLLKSNPDAHEVLVPNVINPSKVLILDIRTSFKCNWMELHERNEVAEAEWLGSTAFYDLGTSFSYYRRAAFVINIQKFRNSDCGR